MLPKPPVLGKTQRARQIAAHAVRRLSGQPHGEPLPHRLRVHDDTSGLDGERHLPRAGNMHAANMLRLRERFLYVAAFFGRDVANIAVQLLAGKRRARL